MKIDIQFKTLGRFTERTFSLLKTIFMQVIYPLKITFVDFIYDEISFYAHALH